MENLAITLSADQALILFDLLERLDDHDSVFTHPADQYVAWHVSAQLEKHLPLFESDYAVRLQEAQIRVKEHLEASDDSKGSR